MALVCDFDFDGPTRAEIDVPTGCTLAAGVGSTDHERALELNEGNEHLAHLARVAPTRTQQEGALDSEGLHTGSAAEVTIRD